MNENIGVLLKKYFEAETSLEEERVLKSYFQQDKDKIKEEHHQYIGIFSYFQESKNEIAKIENIQEIVKNKRFKLSNWHIWSSIASCVAVLIIVFSFNDEKESLEQSVVYIDGVKINSSEVLYSEALHSLENVLEANSDIISSQIDVLNSFIDM